MVQWAEPLQAVRRATNAVQKNSVDSALVKSTNNKRPLTDNPKITKKVIREHGTEHARSGEAGDRAGNEAGDIFTSLWGCFGMLLPLDFGVKIEEINQQRVFKPDNHLDPLIGH